MVNKQAVKSFIKNAMKEKRMIDSDSRRLRKKIKSDIYQVMDTRGYEWKLQRNTQDKRKWSAEIRKAKSMLR